MSKSEKATSQMEDWAADQTVGYDQSNRWGPDYDCSSAVISAWELAGVPVKTYGATYTGNMRGVFLRCGFEDVTAGVDLATGAGLHRGDVLLNIQHHTAMYCGNGMEVEASINENGGVTGGMTGDQTGREFLVRPYRNYPWDCVLRYTGGDAGAEPEKIKPTYYYAVKLPLLKPGMEDISVISLQQLLTAKGYYAGDCDGIFGELTKRSVMAFQADAGLETDGEVGGKTWDKLIGG
ncbi:MAG: peptidoglycan-binding protein [Candidatus Limivicinus sp.]